MQHQAAGVQWLETRWAAWLRCTVAGLLLVTLGPLSLIVLPFGLAYGDVSGVVGSIATVGLAITLFREFRALTAYPRIERFQLRPVFVVALALAIGTAIWWFYRASQ